MLFKAKKEEVLKYMDFVYELALDRSKSGYPTYTDENKTKEDFIKNTLMTFSDENMEILIFEYNGKFEGWIQYYWIPEDNYIGFLGFNINSEITVALKEFLKLMEINFRGYDIYLGFPKSNVLAINFLEENNYECIEEDFDNGFFFKDYECMQEEANILRITKDNYEDFRILHKYVEHNMFWNSDRMLECLDNWNIFVYYKDNEPVGAIYFNRQRTELEIFGIDYVNGIYDEEVFENLLIKVINEGKSMGAEHLTFFNNDGNQDVLLKLGFKCIGKYVCYLIRF